MGDWKTFLHPAGVWRFVRWTSSAAAVRSGSQVFTLVAAGMGMQMRDEWTATRSSSCGLSLPCLRPRPASTFLGLSYSSQPVCIAPSAQTYLLTFPLSFQTREQAQSGIHRTDRQTGGWIRADLKRDQVSGCVVFTGGTQGRDLPPRRPDRGHTRGAGARRPQHHLAAACFRVPGRQRLEGPLRAGSGPCGKPDTEVFKWRCLWLDARRGVDAEPPLSTTQHVADGGLAKGAETHQPTTT